MVDGDNMATATGQSPIRFDGLDIAAGETAKMRPLCTFSGMVKALLTEGGILAVVSFHSLEDRIVKQTLRRLAGIHDGPGRVPPSPLPKQLRLIYGGGIAPTEDETRANPPSRSARLRIGERLRDEPTRVP